MTRFQAFSTSWLFVLAVMCQAGETPADDQVRFARDVQPILADRCYKCHGPDEASREAELRLDTQEGALRTDSPIIVPGNSDQSKLMARVTSKDADQRMPPDEHAPLTASQIETLRRWIDQGAPWGKHWSFESLHRPEPPKIDNAAGEIRNPIDSFVLARLKQENLRLNPEAPRETLLRRVTLDLTGLPPTLDELDAFLADRSPNAYERVVDRLLASPRYGERMVWDWLDAARYADTNGYQGDPTRTMYFWRDWVIDALNRNMPFDQFTVEQLAGDLLPNPLQSQLIATGFHRNHMINGEGGRIAEESRVDYVQDRVETTGTVWLGLTLNCCRCHDHKFDPISQREYYQLAAYFNSVDESGANDANGLANPVMQILTAEQQARLEELQQAEANAANELKVIESRLNEKAGKFLTIDENSSSRFQTIVAKLAKKRAIGARQKVFELLRDRDSEYKTKKKQSDQARGTREAYQKSLPRTMVMRERAEPRETFVLIRGQYDKYGDKVERGTPSILPPLPPNASNDRLALARWLIAKENPLTARVIVNRYWQSFFGVGLVKTSEDFGVQGEPPPNQDLLDWLACEFRDPTVPQPTVAIPGEVNRWNVKHLIRLIVTSATYRQSSRFTPGAVERDPENRLLARGPRYRLPSWMIRDQALAVSGLLVERIGGPPVKGYQPAGVWEDASFGIIRYEQEHGEALYRRSLYQFWRRIVGPTVFFDVANRQTCQVKSLRTNTPLHALTTLNDVTYVEAARALAQRVLWSSAPGGAPNLTLAFRLVLARRPTTQELATLEQSFEKLRSEFRSDPDAAAKLLSVGESKRDESLDATEHAALTALCNSLLNLDEALCKE
ncbi:MAG: PSD1 and planctomycete cytochrome C domain-containing protein [Planctomycetota bacterium]